MEAEEEGGAAGDAVPFRANTIGCVETAARIGVHLSERARLTAIGAIAVDMVHGVVTSSPIGAAGVPMWGFWAAAPGRC